VKLVLLRNKENRVNLTRARGEEPAAFRAALAQTSGARFVEA
jgi:hypothetical protein